MGSLCAVPATLELQWTQITPQGLRIGLMSVAFGGRCPSCGQESGRVHSYYRRTLADLPAQGRAVQLCMGLRRFFCDRDDCPRQTFAEQVPELMARHCPRTARLGMQLREIGLAAGGEAGSRLAQKLAMPASPDTLLRLLRRSPAPPAPVPKVLGVDDWALSRGQEYGTLLCDLETHQPIDLLADRSAEVLAQWLVEHPGVQIISRDRGGEYARGASLGAPQAIQIADRFHLVHNLIQAFEKALDREHALLAQAAQSAALATSPLLVPTPCLGSQSPPGPQPPASVKLTAGQQRREGHARHWPELFAQVKTLRTQGLSLRKIAGRLKLGLHTVCRFVHTDSFPARAAKPPAASAVDAFLPYLRQRWEQGCHNSRQLHRELKDKGFGGSRHMVYRRLAAWRNRGAAAPQTLATSEPHCTGSSVADTQPSPKVPQITRRPISCRRPSARSVVWMLLHPDSKPGSGKNSPRCIQRRALVAALHQAWPPLEQNLWLVEEFGQALRSGDPDNLEAWMSLVEQPHVVVELKNFAKHLRQDWAAVVQAVCQPWSNGQVEGQVNRLKLIKRLMYGRANIDLLKVRVLEMN